MKTRISVLVGLVAAAFAGCAVGPKYNKPEIALPSAYGEGQNPNSPVKPLSAIMPGEEAVVRWWFVFQDPELNSLIARALRDNRDLKQALSKVRQARAQRLGATAGLWPEVDASGSYYRGRGSKNVVIPFGSLGGGSGSGGGAAASSGGSAGAATPSGTGAARPALAAGAADSSGGGSAPPPGAAANPLGQGGLPGVTTSLYQVGFDATWELDVFGGLHHAVEAADASVGAAEEARRSAVVSLVSELATAYVDLRSAQRRLEIAHRNLAAQTTAFTVTHDKFEAGLATRLEVDLQSAQLATTSAGIPALEAEERRGVHLVAFLAGAQPEALENELAASGGIPPLPPQVPVGIPSDLLRRRPDIRAAERQLAIATAEQGVAVAALYPSFNLTGQFGWDTSTTPKHLLEWSSHYYAISPGINWPILDWGHLRSNVKVREEGAQQALLGYQNAVMQALREVEDALVGYEKEQTRRAALDRAVTASRSAFDQSRQKVEEGLSDILAQLQAQRSLLSAEDELVQSDMALRTDLIALYKALGGGWE